MISHKHKAIFVHVPKTAGSSMRVYLRKRGFGSVEYHAPDGSNDDITGVYVNGTSWRIKRNLENEWDKYFKFAFIRNPWDRMVSCWKNRAIKYEDFGKFLKDYPYPQSNHNLIWHTLPQLNHMTDLNGNNMMNYVGKFENLDQDLNTICKKLGIEYSPLPHINKSKHKPYWEYYTNEQRLFVETIYEKEIKLYNYEFGK
tara:strand:+ start:1895 stop:2491 length:597 start_codon:yes stop_codon:yes gene_type:complete